MLRIIQTIARYPIDFAQFLFPQNCAACRQILHPNEKVFCSFCQLQLPKTDYHRLKENRLYRRMWGRLDIQEAAAFLFHEKGNKAQQLLHQLKYRNQTDVGLSIGKWYGSILREAMHPICSSDLILPIPLHPKKERQRGYNQSDFFAEGLSESLQIPWRKDILRRKAENSSQTKKDRFQRWQNVAHIFEVVKPKELENRHIILVDDVITTGATLEACGRKIMEIPSCRLSLLAIASAH